MNVPNINPDQAVTLPALFYDTDTRQIYASRIDFGGPTSGSRTVEVLNTVGAINPQTNLTFLREVGTYSLSSPGKDGVFKEIINESTESVHAARTGGLEIQPMYDREIPANCDVKYLKRSKGDLLAVYHKGGPEEYNLMFYKLQDSNWFFVDGGSNNDPVSVVAPSYNDEILVGYRSRDTTECKILRYSLEFYRVLDEGLEGMNFGNTYESDILSITCHTGNVFFVSGYNNSEFYVRKFRLNGNGDSTTEEDMEPPPRNQIHSFDFDGMMIHNGILYVPYFTQIDVHHMVFAKYNIAGNTWSEVEGSVGTKYKTTRMITVGNMVYGGGNCFFSYNPMSDTFSPLTGTIIPSGFFITAMATDGTDVYFSGYDNANDVSKSNFLYKYNTTSSEVSKICVYHNKNNTLTAYATGLACGFQTDVELYIAGQFTEWETTQAINIVKLVIGNDYLPPPPPEENTKTEITGNFVDSTGGTYNKLVFNTRYGYVHLTYNTRLNKWMLTGHEGLDI